MVYTKIDILVMPDNINGNFSYMAMLKDKKLRSIVRGAMDKL